MRCVYHKSEKIVKNGKSNQGKQRYLCKECKRIFVENPERRHYPKELKEIALCLYTDGYRVYENLPKRKVKKYGCTNWNEGLHSFLRNKLAMLKRKTKAYAKSIRALYRALARPFKIPCQYVIIA